MRRLFQSQILLNRFRHCFVVYFIFLTIRGLEPHQQRLGPFAGIATSTANGRVMFRLKRSVIIEVLYGCSGGAKRMRMLLHQNTAIYASFVPCPKLSLILLRNTVCVGHGSCVWGDLRHRILSWLEPTRQSGDRRPALGPGGRFRALPSPVPAQAPGPCFVCAHAPHNIWGGRFWRKRSGSDVGPDN